MQRIFHTPEGVRDIYGRECSSKAELQRKIQTVFDRYGYESIETPAFEYFEVFSNEVGTIPSKDLYKFFDREGHTLALRPDFTPSVSRACATYYNPAEEAVSLCYTGPTFINHGSSYRGQLRENTQMGVEHIGDDSPEADAELLAMTIECLLAVGLTEFQVSVGQVNYFKSLLCEAEVSAETEERLRALISQKNYFGVEELVKEQKIKHGLAESFVNIPQMFGSVEILEKAKSMTRNADALEAVARLEEIYRILSIYGYEKYICFDFGMLSKYRYYTGIIFQAYTYGTGEPLAKGGRYNELMKHFGKPAASIGFGIVIDTLLMALQSQKISVCKDVQIVEMEYSSSEREQAIKEAQKLRAEGKRVRMRLKKEGF